MPFTFAHPVIVLPLSRLPKQWFSLTGLVIGSMVPDFEYFMRMRVYSIYSHTLRGLFWFDAPLALLLVFIYNALVKDKLIAHLPVWLNRRLSSFNGHPPYSFIYVPVLILSVLTGAVSHLLWDGFTHPGGYFVQHIATLNNSITIAGHRVFIYKLLQHGSTILGFIVIFCAIWFLPQNNTKPSVQIFKYWGIVAFVSLMVLSGRYFTGLALTEYGNWIVSAISGFLLGILAASLFTKHYAPKTVHQS